MVEAQKFEKGRDTRGCVRVVIRRLLGEQIVDAGVLGSGKKEDAMWHVPQLYQRYCTEQRHGV